MREIDGETLSEVRRCETCAPGTFSALQSQSACTFCSPGFYSAATGTGVGVSACAACPGGQFAADSGQTACAPYTVAVCDAGEALSQPGNATSDDRVCEACAAGQFQPFDAFNGTDCQPWSDVWCNGSTYRSAGDATTDTSCTPWTIESCPAGFKLRPPSSYDDGSCSPCEDGTFQPDDDSQAYSCTDWSTQAYNCNEVRAEPMKVFVAGNTTHDSLCEFCPGGFVIVVGDEEDGYPASCRACEPGYYAPAGSGEATWDTCRPCDDGTFASAPAAEVCTNWTVTSCDQGQALSVLPNTTVDGVCASCDPGFFQPHSGTTATTCAACPLGKFAATAGAATCDSWTVASCKCGEEQVQKPNSTADGQCAVCPAGEFQPVDGSQSECTACEVGSFADQPGNCACAAWAVGVSCGAGSFVADGSTTEDVRCEECGTGTFQSADNTTSKSCAPWTFGSARSCEVGEVYLKGSVVADDLCTSACDPGACPKSQDGSTMLVFLLELCLHVGVCV
jgi:hypothetical protein